MPKEQIEFIPGSGIVAETRKAEKYEAREMRLAFEIRASGEDNNMIIEGYAALFNVRTRLYSWLFEEIAPGAFKDCLATSDARFQVNHNSDLVLARMSNKTLEVFEDNKGLYYRATLQDTELSKHYWQMVISGIISQSSFMFEIDTYERSEINEMQDLRKITKVKELYDVGPVTFPAYNETSASARSNKTELPLALNDAASRKRYIEFLTK